MKDIVNKYFEGRATEAELETLLEWLRKRENRVVFGKYASDWEKGLASDRFPDGGEESWNRLKAKFWEKSIGNRQTPG